MQLSPRLLLAASKLRALLLDGAVEAPAAELARTLGASTRTLRTVLGELAEAKALAFESGRGPGALIRVVFTGERRKEKRKEAEEAEAKAEEAETGRGRGGAVHPHGATREVLQQQASSPAPKKRKEAEGEAEEAEGTVVVHRVEVIHRLDPALARLLESLGPRVSAGNPALLVAPEAAPQAGPVVVPALQEPVSSSPIVHRDVKPANAVEVTDAEIAEAVDFRADQQRPHGFKKSEVAFKRDLTRKFNGPKRHEVREILDEKRELAEVKGRTSSVALAPPAIPAAPAFTLEQLRERERRKDAEATKQRIQESAAARRTVST